MTYYDEEIKKIEDFNLKIKGLKLLTKDEEKDDDGIPRYSKVASVHNNGKRTVMFVPLNGNIEDIYLLVHEISHTFDLKIFYHLFYIGFIVYSGDGGNPGKDCRCPGG